MKNSPRCGTLTGYAYGCRCDECVEESRRYHRARYQRTHPNSRKRKKGYLSDEYNLHYILFMWSIGEPEYVIAANIDRTLQYTTMLLKQIQEQYAPEYEDASVLRFQILQRIEEMKRPPPGVVHFDGDRIAISAVPDRLKYFRKEKVRRESRWLLDITGPFCLYPQRTGKDTKTTAARLTDTLSNLIYMPVYCARDGLVMSFSVTITPQDMDRWRKEVYEKETRKRA